jgi:hypothetical protein
VSKNNESGFTADERKGWLDRAVKIATGLAALTGMVATLLHDDVRRALWGLLRTAGVDTWSWLAADSGITRGLLLLLILGFPWIVPGFSWLYQRVASPNLKDYEGVLYRRLVMFRLLLDRHEEGGATVAEVHDVLLKASEEDAKLLAGPAGVAEEMLEAQRRRIVREHRRPGGRYFQLTHSGRKWALANQFELAKLDQNQRARAERQRGQAQKATAAQSKSAKPDPEARALAEALAKSLGVDLQPVDSGLRGNNNDRDV